MFRQVVHIKPHAHYAKMMLRLCLIQDVNKFRIKRKTNILLMTFPHTENNLTNEVASAFPNLLLFCSRGPLSSRDSHLLDADGHYCGRSFTEQIGESSLNDKSVWPTSKHKEASSPWGPRGPKWYQKEILKGDLEKAFLLGRKSVGRKSRDGNR